MTACVVVEWRSATFPPCLELLTVTKDPAGRFNAVTKGTRHFLSECNWKRQVVFKCICVDKCVTSFSLLFLTIEEIVFDIWFEHR